MPSPPEPHVVTPNPLSEGLLALMRLGHALRMMPRVDEYLTDDLAKDIYRQHLGHAKAELADAVEWFEILER